VTLTKY